MKMVEEGEIETAYEKYVDMGGKHHNPFYADGFPALKKGMLENHAQFPNKKITFRYVLGDGDLVSVHSHMVLQAGEKEFSTTHLLRFQGDKIVEMWDCGQAVPVKMTNLDGMF